MRFEEEDRVDSYRELQSEEDYNKVWLHFDYKVSFKYLNNLLEFRKSLRKPISPMLSLKKPNYPILGIVIMWREKGINI